MRYTDIVYGKSEVTEPVILELVNCPSLQRGYISADDLYTTDKVVLKKIKMFLGKDKQLRRLWERMNNKVKVKNDPKNYDARVFCKSRIVDPLFRDGKKLQRLSEAEPRWTKIIECESKPKEYFLKFG